jgi:thermitase
MLRRWYDEGGATGKAAMSWARGLVAALVVVALGLLVVLPAGPAKVHAAPFEIAAGRSMAGAPVPPVAPTVGPGPDTSTPRETSRMTFVAERAPDGLPMRAGSLLVTLRGQGSGSALAGTHRAAGALAVDGLGRPDLVRVQVQPGTAEAAIAAYRADPNVERVEPNYVIQGLLNPNDEQFQARSQYGLLRISAPAAWDASRSGPAVRVAVLDCGIWSDNSSGRTASDGGRGHPDLRGKVVASQDFTGSSSGPDDLCGHGTHVAGIVGAGFNNQVGMAGVGADAVLLNGKVLNDTPPFGSGDVAGLIAGIRWAADNGARVITMSLAIPGSVGTPCPGSLQAEIDAAFARGIVLVAGAGNDGRTGVSIPAGCNRVLAVAATDTNDQRASFSNAGPGVALAAPGVEIVSLDNSDQGASAGYRRVSGTSQAAPHVAGAAALVWTTPFGTSSQAVVDRLTSMADRLPGTGTLWTHGRLNAAAAVGNGQPFQSPLPNDQREAATTISALPMTASTTTTNATSQAGEPRSVSCELQTVQYGRTVWYQYTAPTTLQMTVSTAGSSFDTVVVVYRADPFTGQSVGCNDDVSSGDTTSSARFTAQAGASYLIQIGGFQGEFGSESGSLRVRVEGTPSVPPNACQPRPPVGVSVAPNGAGQVRVTVTTRTAAATPTNAVVEIRFKTPRNAAIDTTDGQTGATSSFVYAPGTFLAQTTFTVRRVGAGAFTVPFDVVDVCGTWSTFAGGGGSVP